MNCRLCNIETDVQFGIKQKLVPVCKKCATIIFFQQSKIYASGKSIYDIPHTYRIKPTRHPEIALEVLNFLKEKLGKDERYTIESIPDVFLMHISARIEEGHTLAKMKAVVYYKHKEWFNDPFMKKFLRPATLFNREKFNNYADEVPEDFNPDNSKEQRAIIRKLSSFGMRAICNEETDMLANELMETGYSKKEFLNLYLMEKL